MEKTTYFAVFEPTKTGFSVYFPDVPGVCTVGKSIEEATENAKEALGLHLWGIEKEGEKLPAATLPPYDEEEMDENAFVTPITVFLDMVRNEMENKAVKKTLTIPYWLNEAAEKEKINFSQVLQTALKEVLEIK